MGNSTCKVFACPIDLLYLVFGVAFGARPDADMETVEGPVGLGQGTMKGKVQRDHGEAFVQFD